MSVVAQCAILKIEHEQNSEKFVNKTYENYKTNIQI